MRLCAVCLPLGGRVASANITIPTVPVGNPGNGPDYNPGNQTYSGAVGYAYNIATYDVTAFQYTVFLNAVAAADPYGLFSSSMAGTNNGNPGISQSGTPGKYSYFVQSNRMNNPVTDVTYWDAIRFANWMDNGQPTGTEGAGTTETGSYNLSSSAISNNGVTRNYNAVWTVPTEPEWYKAAYYDPPMNSNSGGYFPYATGQSVNTSTANFNNSDTTAVGAYRYPSYYGTYDQAGNVFQWTTPVYGSGYSDLRGGSFNSIDPGHLSSGEFFTEPLDFSNLNTGFRLAEYGTQMTSGSNVTSSGLILRNPTGGIAGIFAQLQVGYRGGNWNGTSGIYSSSAAADSTHLTAVGVMINDSSANTAGYSGYVITTSFQNNATADGDILLRTTYYGDANLDGKVDGSDYSLIDSGSLNHSTGWYNGDFNYDGVINGSDYTLIDNTFNTQHGSLTTEIANPTVQLAEVVTIAAVPEPAVTGVMGLVAVGLLGRRRVIRQT